MCPDPDLPVGALEGASKEGGRSHSSDHIPCCTSSPRWGQCLSTAVANSSSQFFFFFLTLTTLLSHRLRDLHQLSLAFSELGPSKIELSGMILQPHPHPTLHPGVGGGDSHSHHYPWRIPCCSFVYLVFLLRIYAGFTIL